LSLQQKRSLALAALIAILVLAALFLRREHTAMNQTVGPKPGLLAPDLELSRLDGQKLRLSSYRGKVVLLDFWATWCVPCREETPHFVELQQQYGNAGLQIIGVSMDDTAEPVAPFYREFRMNYPVVMGNAKAGGEYGGVLGLPIAFLIDRNGRIKAKHIGATKADVFDKEISELLKIPPSN
jgi:thiol-disulfide isomerase/thioredoxin